MAGRSELDEDAQRSIRSSGGHVGDKGPGRPEMKGAKIRGRGRKCRGYKARRSEVEGVKVEA